jgi:pimeloyl-ACP methyl ester carboxylesterase
MSISTSTKTSLELYYERKGTGPDLLLIHGWASSTRMWERFADALQHEFCCWSVDLAGFGASPVPPDVRPDMDFHMHSLIEFCEHHQIQPRAVIGHSMGGMLALKLANARPELVERLVLVCPVVTGRFGLKANTFFSSPVGRFMAARTKNVWALMQSETLAPLLVAPMYVDKAIQNRCVQDFQRATWQSAITALESIAQENLEPILPQIPHPTLVVVGKKDYTVPPGEGQIAAAKLPNARLVKFNKSHHQPLDEEPEQFVQTARDFLSEIVL